MRVRGSSHGLAVSVREFFQRLIAIRVNIVAPVMQKRRARDQEEQFSHSPHWRNRPTQARVSMQNKRAGDEEEHFSQHPHWCDAAGVASLENAREGYDAR